MTNIEKGWILIGSIIIVLLLFAWAFNVYRQTPTGEPPTYKIGDTPANAYKSSMEKFPLKGK